MKEKNTTNPIHEISNIESAKLQILDTLIVLNTVPSISSFILNFTNKICSYCNSFPKSRISSIAATISAFNRLSTVAPNGLQMSEPRIEAYGFVYLELKGNQTIKLN